MSSCVRDALSARSRAVHDKFSPGKHLKSRSVAMKFCSGCGTRVVQRIPAGDNLPRWVCESCSTIHYENPRMIVGCVCEWERKILLCKRAIEPRYGLWTVPAGFLENGET